jgi:fermentation-respiration switch protein FrsA (DUF1100 family)
MQLDRPGRAFAAAGYAVLVFDYRHFGDSSGEPRQLLDLRTQYTDWDAAISFAREHDQVDPDGIVLWGTSFAGGHVIDAAARTPGIAAVIAQAPFTDGLAMAAALVKRHPLMAMRLQLAAVVDQVAGWLGRTPRYVPVTAPPGGFAVLPAPHVWAAVPSLVPTGSTWRNEVAARIMLRLAQHRPVRRAKNVRCPMLVQVLDDETVLPTAPAYAVAKRARRGEAKSYRGLDHFDIYLGDGFEQVNADQVEFLNRHLSQRRRATVV